MSHQTPITRFIANNKGSRNDEVNNYLMYLATHPWISPVKTMKTTQIRRREILSHYPRRRRRGSL